MKDTDTPPAPAPDEDHDSLGAILRRLGPAAVLGALWAVLPAIGGFVLLYYIQDVAAYLQHHGAMGLVLYTLVFVVSGGVGLLPTYSQSAVAGVAFGLTRGSLAALVGFTGASVVGFVLARTIARARMEREIATHPKAKVVRDSLVGRGFWSTLGIVTLVRVPPNSPFALTNLALAGSGVRLPAYVIGTLLGLAPRTILAVWIGVLWSQSRVARLSEVPKPGWWLPANIGAAVLVVLVIAVIARRALEKASRNTALDAED